MTTEALNLYLTTLEARYQLGLITGCELAQAKAQATGQDGAFVGRRLEFTQVPPGFKVVERP